MAFFIQQTFSVTDDLTSDLIVAQHTQSDTLPCAVDENPDNFIGGDQSTGTRHAPPAQTISAPEPNQATSGPCDHCEVIQNDTASSIPEVNDAQPQPGCFRRVFRRFVRFFRRNQVGVAPAY